MARISYAKGSNSISIPIKNLIYGIKNNGSNNIVLNFLGRI